MNRYGITFNNRREHVVKASQAHTAVQRFMRYFAEGEFRPCTTLQIRFLGKVHVRFDVVASVPFDYGENGQGRKNETVAADLATKGEANQQVESLRAAHPEWNFVRVVKRDVPLLAVVQ